MPVLVSGSVAKSHGDVTLSGGFQADHFPEIWDLTACPLTLSFTYDANGLIDDFGGGAHAWAELGVRAVGYGDFNPTWMAEGAGVWLTTDYHWTANTFDPDPPGAPTLDLDDKLILQKGGGLGEGSYNLPSPPPNPWANHRIWFDRDGVDQWQAQSPLAVDGGTYNTGGTYDVVIMLHATGAGSGEAHMTINGLGQGFETDGNWNTMELSPSGMTFSGDTTEMQVFYGLYGYGATHNVIFNDITVEGCLATIEVEIDIKPGSYPNSINLGSKGVIPVAILSTASFDATQVDADTVELAGAGVAVKGKGNKSLASQEDVNGDGLLDLVVKVETENLDPAAFQDGSAVLTGMTTEGVPIEGSDEINVIPAGAECATCATIQDGTLLRSDNVPIVLGYDEWGYNYQAHMFSGGYCDAYRDAAWCQAWKDDYLMMKWNDAWLSNMDCDGDGLLDRYYGFDSYIGSGAWLTNHMWGGYEQDGETCMWNYFVKIVAVPGDAILNGPTWYEADGTEIGPEIWGAFAIIQEVVNDACAGQHGMQYVSPAGAGLGQY